MSAIRKISARFSGFARTFHESRFRWTKVRLREIQHLDHVDQLVQMLLDLFEKCSCPPRLQG